MKTMMARMMSRTVKATRSSYPSSKTEDCLTRTFRLHKLNMPDVNLEIINLRLTMDKPAVSSSSIKTPESKPKKRQRDPEVVAVDSL